MSDDVPGKFDVSINGRPYMVDTQFLEAYRSQTIDPIRRQADTSASTGEASLNPEGFWRRSPESFHKGAGQARYDASGSDPERFNWSYGVDVWTEGQVSMLDLAEDSGLTPPSGGSITRCIEVGGRLLAIENNGSTNLHWYSSLNSNPPAATTYTGTDITDICNHPTSDSKFFYVDDGHLYLQSVFNVESDGDLVTSRSPWISGDPSTIAQVCSVNGRLLCTDTSGDLYDISATGLATLPAALATDFGERLDVAFAGGYIYLVNYFSRAEVVYKTTIKSDGSGLEVPTIAATLPTGAFVYGIYGYLDFVLVQVDNALRLGVVNSDGTLTLGQQFAEGDITQQIFTSRDFAADGQYVYVNGFDNNAPGGARGGILRLDLSIINDALVPAYAADLDVGSNLVRFTYILNGRKYMLLGDRELWRSSTTDKVSAGALSVGEVSFGMREPKLYLDPDETATDGTVSHRFTLPDGSSVDNANTPTAVPAVDWRMTLVPSVSGDDMTVQYPVLRALPQPAPVDVKQVPVLLHDRIECRNGQIYELDVDAELALLEDLRTAGLITYIDGGRSYTAQVTGVNWQASERNADGDQWNGTALVTLKAI